MSDDVLPGFEDEASAIAEMKRNARIEKRQRAMIPAVTGPDKRGRRTLTRTHAYIDPDGTQHRAVTALLSGAEWREITRAVLAERALAPLDDVS